MDVMILAGNSRSLIANRGDLISAIKSRGMQVCAVVPRSDYLIEVEELGIRIFTMDMGRTGTNPFRDIVYLVRLFFLIREIKPRIVFGYTIKPVVYGSLAAKLAGVKNVYAMITGLGHVYTTDSKKNRIIRVITNLLYKVGTACCTKVFFQNPDDLSDIRQANALSDPNKAVLVNGSGVNTKKFPEAPLSGDGPTFLFIGRLLAEKGIKEFVEAAAQLAPRWPDARFIAVGPHDASLPHSVDAEDLEAWKQQGVVDFIGGVDDVLPWLRQCSVFVLPSYREGTPRSVLEAMSVGRAIVTSDAPGCRETVEHGKNGFIVPPKDSKALAAAMQKFLVEPGLMACMAEQSRRIVQEKYEVSKVNESILGAMGLL